LFSKRHELFGHQAFGREAADLAVQTMRRGRKTAISLAFDTQSSRKDAMPLKIVELVKVNACFAVKTWRSNDGFFGDGSFQAGIRATELRPGKEVGTSIVTGATPERFEIVKWFYIAVADDTGYDAATAMIARAMTYLDRRAAPPRSGGGLLAAGPHRRSRHRGRRRCAGRARGPGRRASVDHALLAGVVSPALHGQSVG
jgi:DNA segregation ATPase FtsK/SpoIIIE, S-DNA-T family